MDSIENMVLSVPSGNFGNVTAGLIARRIGLPYKRIIAATNAQRHGAAVPRVRPLGSQPHGRDHHQRDGHLAAEQLSRACWNWASATACRWRSLLSSQALDDDETRAAMRTLHRRGYLADPHSALAWAALDRSLEADEEGVFLCTAHPAKFMEVIEETLGIEVPLPAELAAVRDKTVLSSTIAGDFLALKRELTTVC